MGGMNLRRRIELEHASEQAVVKLVGIAGRQVGAAGAADQQRVAGEDVVLDQEAWWNPPYGPASPWR